MVSTLGTRLPDCLFFLFIIGDTGVIDVIFEKLAFDNNLKDTRCFGILQIISRLSLYDSPTPQDSYRRKLKANELPRLVCHTDTGLKNEKKTWFFYLAEKKCRFLLFFASHIYYSDDEIHIARHININEERCRWQPT